jgi:hypothetical protein
MADSTSQKLVASTLNPDPAEELACRIKDPLWFLARQWQSGEFQAENGGAPIEFSIAHRDTALIEANIGGSRSLDRTIPLDRDVEAETSSGDAPAWQAASLEYAFDVSTTTDRLAASEYSGIGLDWWHFDRVETKTAAVQPMVSTTRMVPTMLHYKGAPHPRWWRFEDGDGDLDQPIDAEPNALSTLLPEFFYTDIDNWFIAPLPIEAGSVRYIEALRVVDSFGIVTTLGPATSAGTENDTWHLFSLSDETKPDARPDGAILFVPHVAGDVLDNDLIEDVRLLRDEDANLVWAVEFAYTDEASGALIRNGDGERIAGTTGQLQIPNGYDGIYRLQSETPAHWIPYLPRSVGSGNGAPDGEFYLRRGRTIEELPTGHTQYKGKIVAESMRLNDEAAATVGVRIRRIKRYTRGTDGSALHWIARSRDATDRSVSPSGLTFDYVDKV